MSNTRYRVSAKCSPSLCPQGCWPSCEASVLCELVWGEGGSDAPLGTGSSRTST